ncbi:hypothetical protein K438DRAFT_1758056 [Mycena galopus ATCC 62051]|nr:hypothetical protein K438DRAFT_1758056 [Mycena galopus ATCC 62051]
MVKKRRSAAQKAITQSLKSPRGRNTHPDRRADEIDDESPSDSDSEAVEATGAGSSSPHCRHCPALRSASTRLSHDRALLTTLLEQSHTELSAARQKINRLESEKSDLRTALDELRAKYSVLVQAKSSLEDQLSTVSDAHESQSQIQQQQLGAAEERARTHHSNVKILRLQVERAKASAAEFKRLYDQISEWKCKEGGVFSSGARRVFRLFVWAGCAEAKVGSAIRALLEEVGVMVQHLPSARTVQRAIKEGGEFGLIQLGYEISHAESFGVSTDGTSHRGITMEGTHLTVKAASYQDDNNTANPTNHKWVTRVVGVEKALDHTAAEQHRGFVNTANRIVSSYAGSPLAKRLNDHLTFNKFFQKLNFQSGDHAADGKKFQALNGDLKDSVVLETLGESAVDSLPKSEFLQQVADVPEEEVQQHLASRGIENPTPLDTCNAAQAVVQIHLGSAIYDNVTDNDRALLDLLISAGCGGHKDLNALVYGTKRVRLFWLRNPTCTPPVLLPNKANDATIHLAHEASAASKKAVESSTSGAIKLIELAGATFRNKNSKKGYQDRYTAYMTKMVVERYGSEALGNLMHRFAEVSATRYQSFSYAAAELLVHHDITRDLIQDICDGKGRSGLIFDQSVPDSELTLDGNPLINPGLLNAIRQAEKRTALLREDDASGKNRKFNLEVAERITTKGREAREHREALEEDRRLERARLAAVGLELDLAKVNTMTVAKLRDQLRIFKFIVGDPELTRKAVWGDKRRAGLLAVVVAAVNRHKDKIPTTEPTPDQQDALDQNQSIEQETNVTKQHVDGPSVAGTHKLRIDWSEPDRYEIVRRLGGGRYSEVFEGVDTVNNEPCAMKVLKAVAGHKIKREIKVLRNLAGAPNCVALLDVVRDPSRRYYTIITEYVDNTEWKELYTRLTGPDIRHYMFQLLTALDFVHSQGIIHRDVKPGNVMINHARRELRLIDWGLAEFYHPDVEYHVSVGSRPYKPPELLVGYKRYDYSLDLWSTGCFFAAMIFRKQQLFRSTDNEDQLLKIMRVLGTEPFDAYLKAYDISYETESEDLLASYPPVPFTRFVTPDNTHLATPDALVLLDRLLRFDPRERYTAAEAMACPYFGTVRVESGAKEEVVNDSGFASMSGDEAQALPRP